MDFGVEWLGLYKVNVGLGVGGLGVWVDVDFLGLRHSRIQG